MTSETPDMCPSPTSPQLDVADVERELDRRIELIELASRVGCAEACKQTGFSRFTLYRAKKQFEKFGREGLRHAAERAVQRRPELRTQRSPVQSVVDSRLVRYLAILQAEENNPHLRRGASHKLRRMRAAYQEGGVEGLRAWIRRQVAKDPLVGAAVEAAVLEVTHAHPSWGRRRVTQAVQQRGLPISGGRVGRIWKTHGLLKPERSGAGWRSFEQRATA